MWLVVFTFIQAFYTLSEQKMGSQEKEREGPREGHKDIKAQY